MAQLSADTAAAVWLRSTLEFTEVPRRICVVRHRMPDGRVHTCVERELNPMQAYAVRRDAATALETLTDMPLRTEERVELDSVKRKDLHACSKSLPEIPLVGANPIDEYGDLITAPVNPGLGPTWRDLYPYSDSSDSDSSEGEDG